MQETLVNWEIMSFSAILIIGLVLVSISLLMKEVLDRIHDRLGSLVEHANATSASLIIFNDRLFYLHSLVEDCALDLKNILQIMEYKETVSPPGAEVEAKIHDRQLRLTGDSPQLVTILMDDTGKQHAVTDLSGIVGKVGDRIKIHVDVI
jgi:hypothetical protein